MEKRNVTIHRNAIENFFMAIKDYIKHHRRPVLLGFLLFIVISGGTIGAAFYYDYRSDKELRAYEEIVGAYNAGSKDDAAFDVMIAKMNTLVDNAKWGYMGRHGRYIVAGLYFEKKRYEDAMKNFDLYASKSSSVYATVAILQSGACAEELGNFDKALEAYKKAETLFKDSKFADRIYYDLGRMYAKKGELVSARESFNKVLTQFPTSPFVQPSKARIFLLGLTK